LQKACASAQDAALPLTPLPTTRYCATPLPRVEEVSLALAASDPNALTPAASRTEIGQHITLMLPTLAMQTQGSSNPGERTRGIV